ncbi:hypothetical protein LJC17_04345 [Acholeplasma sp. OttesenSCG-928-E16]|nr:hypothetical protein [Acholeplasma sp. OttesenSCG-928-E16]
MGNKRSTFKFDILWAVFFLFLIIGLFSMIASLPKPFLIGAALLGFGENVLLFFINHSFVFRLLGILGFGVALLVFISKIIICSQEKKAS